MDFHLLCKSRKCIRGICSLIVTYTSIAGILLALYGLLTGRY